MFLSLIRLREENDISHNEKNSERPMNANNAAVMII